MLQLFLNSCATDTVLVTLLRVAVETTIAVVLAVVYGLLGLSGSEHAVEPLTLSPSPSPPHPFPVFPVPNKPDGFCGR